MNQDTSNKSFDAIIIGAGAAGLMCGITSAQNGHRTLLLEHNNKIGKKIRISGGGRCNFTNIHAKAENYLSKNPHFCKSALACYHTDDFIKLVNKHNIRFHEKKLGQLFCDINAQEIIDMLRKECEEYNTTIKCDTTIVSIKKDDSQFIIKTTSEAYVTSNLVIATGGLSIPPLGATKFGYTIAKQFGHTLIPTEAALVPLTFASHDLEKFKPCAGISIDCNVSCNNHSFRENILFTHRGLSGPAILQISSYFKNDTPLIINLLPDDNAQELLDQNKHRKTTLSNFLHQYFAKRFVEHFVKAYFINKPLHKYTPKELETISNKLNHWSVQPNGTEGYAKAEVTTGGVNTNELSSKTMESKKEKGLYFIGEVLDVTGHLGGYNFQWAWASGFCAGNAINV
ncbi:MAG: putative Rossmann fold flavoprotein [Candidatus Omnitrophota bacterium]|jgi:predicted Rossmann fold flavoprotein